MYTSSNAILARNPELHFFRVTLYSRSIGRTLKTKYTVQHKQAKSLIRRECCSYDDGDTHTCTQCISSSVFCKWFRWAILPQMEALEAEVFKDRDTKRCVVCGQAFLPKSNRAKYCPDCAARVHRRQKAESERKGGQEWKIRGQESQHL